EPCSLYGFSVWSCDTGYHSPAKRYFYGVTCVLIPHGGVVLKCHPVALVVRRCGVARAHLNNFATRCIRVLKQLFERGEFPSLHRLSPLLSFTLNRLGLLRGSPTREISVVPVEACGFSPHLRHLRQDVRDFGE
ncbi:unnamed protein product, partial [Ectocarpus sp. 8 AP-2014]